MNPDPEPANFVWVCCQAGAEPALKADIAKHHPEWRFSFSRPSFVTFKLPPTSEVVEPTQIRSAFQRAAGFSLGNIDATVDALLPVIDKLPRQNFKHLHVWARHSQVPGERGFEPFHQAVHRELGIKLKDPISKLLNLKHLQVNRPARVRDWIADLIVMEPNQWWVGWHQASNTTSGWPGGIPLLEHREDVVSRAYWKMEEALRWSRLPIVEGDRCIEIGSSPGGSCQSLLENGLHVVGLDPAEMDPRVLAHPHFEHVRARAADIKRREFAGIPWLMSDANISPLDTLNAIEGIVTNQHVNIRGMLITLKLLSSKMANDIEDYLQRIRSWGFQYVRTRQLAFNRRELCVLAVRRKHILRRGFRRRSTSQT